MQTLIRWARPIELTAEEKRVAQALHRIGKFYVLLREIATRLPACNGNGDVGRSTPSS